jgi:Fe-S-cluster containining protein
MSSSLIGLLMTFLVYAVILLLGFGIMVLMPQSALSRHSAKILNWLPPFIRGDTLRDWAATIAEKLTKKRLAGTRTGATAERLASEVEDAAMHAMLPLAGPEDLGRVVACPETGQGRVGVTAPEALAIAAYLRKNLPETEQKEIHKMAAENAKKIASGTPVQEAPGVLPCPLQGENHVCCVYAARPLRCRILHAVSIAKSMPESKGPGGVTASDAPDAEQHEQTVAEGIELGVTRALKASGLSSGVYELNSALAAALGTPDAAERWAKGEEVFHTPLVPSEKQTPRVN